MHESTRRAAQAAAKAHARPADSPRASELPDGTVVATRYAAWVKVAGKLGDFPWCATNGGTYSNRGVDEELAAGARVLRYGYDGSSDE